MLAWQWCRLKVPRACLQGGRLAHLASDEIGDLADRIEIVGHKLVIGYADMVDLLDMQQDIQQFQRINNAALQEGRLVLIRKAAGQKDLLGDVVPDLLFNGRNIVGDCHTFLGPPSGPPPYYGFPDHQHLKLTFEPSGIGTKVSLEAMQSIRNRLRFLAGTEEQQKLACHARRYVPQLSIGEF